MLWTGKETYTAVHDDIPAVLYTDMCFSPNLPYRAASRRSIASTQLEMPLAWLSAAPVNSGSDDVTVGLPVVTLETRDEVEDDSTGGDAAEEAVKAVVDVNVKVEIAVEAEVRSSVVDRVTTGVVSSIRVDVSSGTRVVWVDVKASVMVVMDVTMPPDVIAPPSPVQVSPSGQHPYSPLGARSQ